MMHTNSLIHESSPYLRQHAHNPVDWYAWNDETLNKALGDDKMILVSIGYAACHWCHVMERECFEDTEVAGLMNKHFICIKVDREERPDVDQVYMDAALLINGNGGWPLNALALPDGRPFFAGTYFPRQNWMRLLQYFADVWQEKRNELVDQATHLTEGVTNLGLIDMQQGAEPVEQKELDNWVNKIVAGLDETYGGTAGNVKFPMPSLWKFLLQYITRKPTNPIKEIVTTTLNNMALAGIFDQVGGGFSRYATDARWHVPHFEKMLYDNAQLVSLYSHAFLETQDELYHEIVYRTTDFMKRELLSPEGAFYAALDADSDGEEGKFYVWSRGEIEEILQKNAASYIADHGITSAGNWEEGKNIPDLLMGGRYKNSDRNSTTTQRLQLNTLLLNEREKRLRPATDDKILTSWNALAVQGFTDAYRIFGDPVFFTLAKNNIDFLTQNLVNEDGSVWRNYKNGRATIHGFLDDYAFMIRALIDFYQVSFQETYLLQAKSLLGYCLVNFYHESSGMFFYTDGVYASLIARKMETTDSVIPSSNSEMARNLLHLGIFFNEQSWLDKSMQMASNMKVDIEKNPGYYSNWLSVIIEQSHMPFEIAIVGKNWKPLLAEMQCRRIPQSLFMGGDQRSQIPLLQHKTNGSDTSIYICRNHVCQLPVDNIDDAVHMLV